MGVFDWIKLYFICFCAFFYLFLMVRNIARKGEPFLFYVDAFVSAASFAGIVFFFIYKCYS